MFRSESFSLFFCYIVFPKASLDVQPEKPSRL